MRISVEKDLWFVSSLLGIGILPDFSALGPGKPAALEQNVEDNVC